MQKEVSWLLQEKHGGKLTPAAKRDIKILKCGEPLDYVIGFMEFLGCKINLSKKPLIPRVETKFWVEKAIEEIKKDVYYKIDGRQKVSISMLDMFAGSGCIGIAIAKHIPNAHVVFADAEKNALVQVKINIEINSEHISNQPSGVPAGPARELEKRCSVVRSNMFQHIKGGFDYIFANPPYIPTKKKAKVQPLVMKYEPKAALFGGKDGLLYIQKFLSQAKDFLNPQGAIYMEFDSFQKLKIGKLIKKFGYSSFQFHKDQYGKWRYVVISY